MTKKRCFVISPIDPAGRPLRGGAHRPQPRRLLRAGGGAVRRPACRKTYVLAWLEAHRQAFRLAAAEAGLSEAGEQIAA